MTSKFSEDEQKFLDLVMTISKERRDELERSVYESAKYQLYALVQSFSAQYHVNVSLVIHDKEEGNA